MDNPFNVKKDINYTSLSQLVYSHVKRMIMTQELKGGQKIPEEAIAKIFSVSRTPIREAMRELEKNGLVKIYPRKYAEVVKIEQEDRKDIGLLRIQLDTLSVKLLCQTITDSQYNELKEIAEQGDRCAEEGEIAGCFEMDSAFHCKMADFTGNRYLYDFVMTLDLKVQLIRNIMTLDIDIIKEGVSLHTTIADAIYEKDCKKAEELVYRHLYDYYFSTPGDLYG
jgi:GntR family transcriptional regulator, rspAB operon transcriptional repressor